MNPPSAEEIVEAKQNKELRKNVIERSLGLVYRLARFYSQQYNVEFDDLVGEGVKGLISAIWNFDPNKGMFSTIAVFHIRLRMLRFIQKELNWNKVFITDFRNDNEESVVDFMKIEPIFHTDSQEELEKYIMRDLKVPDRVKKMLLMRVRGYSYQEIGKAFGLTKERIRQIVKSALKKALEVSK